jgi:hypothetical protein
MEAHLDQPEQAHDGKQPSPPSPIEPRALHKLAENRGKPKASHGGAEIATKRRRVVFSGVLTPIGRDSRESARSESPTRHRLFPSLLR